MPRIVDHDARRRELADGVCRLVARGGVEAASVRAVAAETGWSLGAVRHYFATTEEMLRFAFSRLAVELAARIKGHESEPDLRRRATLMLEELLPLDERRYAEQSLWLALVTRSRFDPALADFAAMSFEATRSVARAAVCCLRQIDQHDAAQQFADQDDELAAADLHLTLDGLFLHGVVYPRRSAAALMADLQRALDHVVRRP